MRRPSNRRAVLVAAGVAAVVAAAGPVPAQLPDISGEVAFAGGAAIPEGELEIYLEDPAIQESELRRAAEARMKSDGKSEVIAFSFSSNSTTSPTLRVVARLERGDGRLVARGSAQVETGSPVHVTLNVVIY